MATTNAYITESKLLQIATIVVLGTILKAVQEVEHDQTDNGDETWNF